MTDTITQKQLYNQLLNELARVETEHPPGQSPSGNRRRLNAFRETLQANLARIEAAYDSGGSGRMIAELLTALSDAFVEHAFKSSIGNGHSLTLIALGGYGREEMSPYSDIDLLCIAPENMTIAMEPVISGMIQFLWDMNFDVGHSTRTIEDSIAVAEGDSDFATSLLEARYITGEASHWDELKKHFTDWRAASNGKKLTFEKLDERNKRLLSFHKTVQIQEPNIKECPGGLRDIHVIRWLAELTGAEGLSRFKDVGCITEMEIGSIEDDLDFFLRLRHAIHFLSGRKSDVLDHVILPDAAQKAGYSGKGIIPVESIMHDYYMRAGRIKRITDRVCTYIFDEVSEHKYNEFTYAGDNILISDTGVSVPAANPEVFAEDPCLLIRLCTVAGIRGLPLSAETSAVIESFLENADDSSFLNDAMADAFRELFNMSGGIAATLRLMHSHGILTRALPEFDEISWHYQFDFYHTYTTDEHSIRVVENLEGLLYGGDASLAWLSDMAGEVTAKGALFLAGLLHDIGKKTGRGHAKAGEKMASRALKRLGCDRRTVKLVRFLVAEHLIMTHISQRRDIDDEDTIRDFIERVGSTGRLRLLTLLTFADLMALSDSALTDWKKSLLQSLFNKSLILIEKGFEEHAASYLEKRLDSILNTLEKELPKEIVAEHLGLLPEQYMRVTKRKAIRDHIKGILKMKKRGAWASFRRGPDYSLLTVISRDYSHALSDICGAITSCGINIIGARIFTRDDGIIIDTFLVTNHDGDPVISDESQSEFKRNVVDVVTQKADVNALIMSYHRRWRRRKRNVVFSPPRVKVHNDVSSNYSVVDVFAIDYTGLLYDVTSVLASLDIDIHTAKIGTDEDQVADAFYINQPGGGKILNVSEIEQLKHSIVKKMREGYDDQF